MKSNSAVHHIQSIKRRKPGTTSTSTNTNTPALITITIFIFIFMLMACVVLLPFVVCVQSQSNQSHQVMSRHATSCHVMWCDVMWCDIHMIEYDMIWNRFHAYCIEWHISEYLVHVGVHVWVNVSSSSPYVMWCFSDVSVKWCVSHVSLNASSWYWRSWLVGRVSTRSHGISNTNNTTQHNT